MATSLPASKALSSPAITLAGHGHLSTPSVDTRFMPPPLSTHTTRAKSSGPSKHLNEDSLGAEDINELSQKLVRTYSLGARANNQYIRDESQALYICSLCYHPLPVSSKPYVLPDGDAPVDSLKSKGGLRIFCKDCWVWVYNLSICWKCGEIVARMEERVGFGWCWWHWGCLGCLICKVCFHEISLYLYKPLLRRQANGLQTPMKPPPWTDDSSGIELFEPPICEFCIRDWELAEVSSELIQHAVERDMDRQKKQAAELESAASDILHSLRKGWSIEQSLNTVEECGPISKKRSRPTETPGTTATESKRHHSARLEDIAAKSVMGSASSYVYVA
ncbi:hypothetical protein MMC19_001819 [Ptychographa xylographoides]|nr:hypothetical protein [Ptychographa xylographoides]